MHNVFSQTMYSPQVMFCKSGGQEKKIAHGKDIRSVCHVALICHAVNSFPLRIAILGRNHRMTLWTSHVACSRTPPWTRRSPFLIPLMCNAPLNCHLQLDKSLSSHSAQTPVKLPGLLLWAPGWNYLQWVSSAKKHPGIDLLPGRLRAMPLFSIWTLL